MDDGFPAGENRRRQTGAVRQSARRTDRAVTRKVAFVHRSLTGATDVLDVDAGAGSYEPVGPQVTDVEPSATVRAQRPAGRAVAIDAVAEALPFSDNNFGAAMITFSIHQWSDLAAELAELRRVTRGPIVLLDPGARTACSAWSFVAADDVAAGIDRLGRALADGSWDRAYGDLRTRPTYLGSLTLIVNAPGC